MDSADAFRVVQQQLPRVISVFIFPRHRQSTVTDDLSTKLFFGRSLRIRIPYLFMAENVFFAEVLINNPYKKIRDYLRKPRRLQDR